MEAGDPTGCGAGYLLGGAIEAATAEFDGWNVGTALCSRRGETFAVQPFAGETVAEETLSGKTAGASASTRLAQPFSGNIADETFPGKTDAAPASRRLAQQ